MNYKLTNNIYLWHISARFELEKGYPSLWYFDAGGREGRAYDGPRDLNSLMEFVNYNEGHGPPVVKVYW